ncbi:hypothetical protein Tco_0838313 [Tanacetum coccineum]|uniref:MAK10-like protein n=1 Tax=Tanacetum coccineum TaxID=301880 RepID=A0ABQ5ANG0_9ASTR
MHTMAGDDVAGIKRRRRDLYSDGVRNLATASGRCRLKEDLESYTGRRLQIFYDHVNPVTRRTIDQSASGKLRDRNTKESWALLENLALYDNKSWNDPRYFAKPVKEISLPQDVLMNKITTSCEIYSGPHDTQYCMEDPEQAFVEYASSRTDEAGVGRGFVATANAVIDYTKAKIAVGEEITIPVFGVKGVDLGKEEAPYWTMLRKKESYNPRPRSDGIGAQTPYYARKDFLDCHLPGEQKIARDAKINPFKDVLVFRQLVEFLGALPINLKRNM